MTCGSVAFASDLPAVFSSSATALKGRKTAVNAVFNITLSAVSNQSVSVNYATVNNTALAGSDYTAVSGTLNIPANTRSTTITVPVLAGAASGSDKTFYLDLSSPLNATLGNSRATGTILENSPSLAFSPPQSAGRYRFQFDDYVGSNLYPVIGANYDMELVDFDNDGKLDLIVPASSGYDSHVWLFQGNGNGTFKEPTVLGNTNNASGTKPLAIGDLNNDGFIDYVVANYGTSPSNGRLDIAFSGTGGPLSTSVTIGNYPMAVTLADLNKDGFLDIAVACDYGSAPSGTNKVRVLLNNGDGTFGAPIELDTTSNGIMGITAADFNKDGNIDLAVTLENVNKIAVFYNLGDISTSSASQTTVGSYPTGIASGDLNGDGYPDFITANYMSRNISVVIKKQTATAAVFNAVNYDVGIQPYHIKLVDFDGDGFPDIYASNSDGAVILQNLQDGTFSQPMFIAGNSVGVATGDIDGDGDIDLVQSSDGAGRVRIQLNRKIENILFAPIEEKIHVANSNSLASFLINADFSGSGYDDIIAAMPGFGGSSITLYHYKNNQNGTLADPQLMYSGTIPGGRQAAVADFNGDGKLDLAVASSIGGAGVYLFINNGSGTLVPAGTIDTLTGANSLIALDVDGDGDQDLAVSHTLGSISILRNNGSGTFTLSAPADFELPTGSLSAGHLASGKFSSDNITDLAVAVSEGIAILSGTGVSLGSSTIVPLTGKPKTIVSGDFNGDGTADLAAIIPTLGKLAILLNNGSGGFAAPVYYSTDTNPTSLSSADVDNDGDTDLLVISDSGDAQVFNNDGSSVFTLLSRISPHSGSIDRTGSFANLDGNSYPDFATGELFTQITAANRFGLFSYRNVMQPDAPKLASLSINPGSTPVSTAVTGTVTLSSNAPSGGARVMLSNNNGCATVPVSVLVPQGAATANFTITPSSDCEDTSVLVGASFMGSYRAARLYVLPIIPSTVTITPATALGGESLSVTVTLNAPAKAGGMLVNLSSNSAKLLLPYTSTTITVGKSSITFPVTTKAVSDVTIASVTAATAKGSATGSVTLNPVAGSVAFNAPVTASTAYGNSLITDDFNKDSKADLAYSWYGLSFVSGNGNGSFGAATSYPATYTTKVAKGDFDKDGYQDIAVLNPGSPSFVSIFLNDKNGGFLPKVDYTIDGTNSGDFAVGDFNGDGAPDIAIANPQGPSRISILLNNGSGGFVNGVSNTEAFYLPRALVTGDFNGDDIIDIATIRDVKITILSGNSDANGKGDGTFQISSEITLTSSSGYPLCNQIAAADLNNDALLDLVLPCFIDNGSNDSKEIRTFRNTGFGFVTAGSIDLLMGGFSSWHNIPVTIADFNGDGAPDIAVSYSQYNTPGNVSVALNNGAGLFSTAFSFPADIHPAGIVAADFDKDGDMDLAVIHENSGKLSIYTNALLTPSADIAVALSDAPDPVNTSGTITYTATVTNNSANTSKSVVLSDVLPIGTSYVSATSSKGSCSHTTGTVTCTIGDVSSTDTVIVTIRVSAPASPASLTNTATLTSQSGDPDSTNNTASVTTQVTYPSQVLTVGVSGSGSGTVTPSSGTISWNGRLGTATYSYNTLVTLTPNIDEGSVFAGWSGACTGSGACQVTLNSATLVNAWFEPVPVNGECGSDNGKALAVTPENFCNQGSQTYDIGTGPWNWNCSGWWGGSDATCSARVLRYVAPAGLSSGSCDSWANACDLKYVLGTAVNGTDIWVAAGTYTPTSNSDRAATFTLPTGVSLYGGFAGTETDRNQRNGLTNITILSGEIGAQADATDNSRHVITSSGGLLDGFTVTGGYADDAFPASGGGIKGSGAFSNIIITGNHAHNYGGGFYGSGSLTAVTFNNNSATAGGGIYTTGDTALLNATLFNNNSETGAAIYAEAGTLNLLHATLAGNNATSAASGIYLADGTLTVTNSIVWGDSQPITIINGTAQVTYSDIQGGYAGTGNLNSDPLLGPFGAYGGPLPTLPLSLTSPAFSAANVATCLPVDARGLARPQGAGCEMGAFEIREGGIPQSITIDQPAPTSALTGSPVIVSASASSGQPVFITSSGACSGSGSDIATITMSVEAGTCSVRYVQYGNTTYDQAPEIIETVTLIVPVTGVCGSSSGGQFDTAPSTTLCLTGDATTPQFNDISSWNWVCRGINTGPDSPECSASINQYPLTIAFAGSGGTAITSSPAGITCFAVDPANGCSSLFNYGTPVQLNATFSGISELAGWTNADTASGNPVTVTVNGVTTVTASFNPIQQSVLIYGKVGYDSLGMALMSYTASDSFMVKGSYAPQTETVLFDKPYSVSLAGGYNDSWVAQPGIFSRIKGSMKVKAGKVTVKGIKVLP